MKKYFWVLILCVLSIFTLLLTAFGDENGTYYPESDEMKKI